MTGLRLMSLQCVNYSTACQAVAEVFAAVAGDEYQFLAVGKAVYVIACLCKQCLQFAVECFVFFDFVYNPVEGVDDGVAGTTINEMSMLMTLSIDDAKMFFFIRTVLSLPESILFLILLIITQPYYLVIYFNILYQLNSCVIQFFFNILFLYSVKP